MALLSSVKPCVHLLLTRQQHVACALHRHLRSRIKSKLVLQTPTLRYFQTQSDYTHRPSRNNFKKTNPAVFKIMEIARQKDKLSEDWDLIYNDKNGFPKYPMSWYLAPARFIPLSWFVGAVPYHFSDIITDLTSGEYVIYGFLILPVYVETLSGIFALSVLNFLLLKLSTSVPHRIYYNYKEDRYLCVRRSLIPGVCPVSDFTAGDVEFKTPSSFASSYYPWVDLTFYLKNKKTLLLPQLFYRAADCQYMLRKINGYFDDECDDEYD